MRTHGAKFTDRGEGEELIDTKVGVVHSTDKGLRNISVVLVNHN